MASRVIWKAASTSGTDMDVLKVESAQPLARLSYKAGQKIQRQLGVNEWRIQTIGAPPHAFNIMSLFFTKENNENRSIGPSDHRILENWKGWRQRR